MNTDNMLVSGETLDYGPCAFMDDYDPEIAYSSIDLKGRYAYRNQPTMAHWNLASFASTLLPLIDQDLERAREAAEGAVNTFDDLFRNAWASEFRAKLGLEKSRPGDPELAAELLEHMASARADFTLTFRRLSSATSDTFTENPEAAGALRELFRDTGSFDRWLARWRARLALETRGDAARQSAMRAANPAYIPRNHRIEQVIAAALDGNFGPFEQLAEVLSRPFDDQPSNADYQMPPLPSEVVHTTFCGT
jgi:uncharacterized protein YdiU (UPF0061 family)